ncbi:MAG TPA: fumarylacetoacetate hydrolase family protein [Aestuariivirga sp.]|nr:fumarylacetoacetate hydrolase family protein [Aestuariivirga sp.]
MKFVRFEHHRAVAYGILGAGEVTELSGSIFGSFHETERRHLLSEVLLLAPATPTKIVCIGQNYLEHVAEIGSTPPDEPLFFLKPPTSLIGPGDEIVYPHIATRVDFEGELAIVIRRDMKNVPKASVGDYVLGYSCFNDITERDLVNVKPLNLTLGKSFDTFAAFGPCIETDVDPDNLQLRTLLNGKVMQEDSTRDCVFDVATILSFLSERMTLCAGDIVATGTPKGIAPMKVGDVVEVEIEKIGRLTNVVGSEASGR